MVMINSGSGLKIRMDVEAAGRRRRRITGYSIQLLPAAHQQPTKRRPQRPFTLADDVGRALAGRTTFPKTLWGRVI